MKFLKKPFFLGSLRLENNVFYAPLAGCSDHPFREMALHFERPGLFYCEMVKIDAVIRHDPHTYRLLDYSHDMHPIGAQLCGSKPKIAKMAAKIVEDLGFDVIDLNCGCPVDKVTKDGSGSGMLKTPELIGEVLSEIISAVKIPVTVKIRAGWDERSILAPEIVQIAEQAGAQAIAIHGRTREQAYKGPANWDYIRDSKALAKNILVIGNGDLFDAKSAEEMFVHTGCDAVLVSRGTLGQPWIAEDMMRSLLGATPIDRGIDQIKKALFSHFEAIINYQNERQALLDFRRVGCWYLKRCSGAKALRMELNKAESTKQAIEIFEKFPWETLSLAQEKLFAESEA